MARITVEDCVANIENIFEMVLVAAKRARRLAHGADPLVDMENDKTTVVALREIAAGHVTSAILEEVEPPPGVLSSLDREMVSGIGRHQGRMIILLNLQSVLNVESD